jgi:hypothetical protein
LEKLLSNHEAQNKSVAIYGTIVVFLLILCKSLSQLALTTGSHNWLFGPTPMVFLEHCAPSTRTQSLLGATPWGRRRHTGRVQRRDWRQTTPSDVTNKRHRCTGGRGVTSVNKTTIHMIGRGAGQCNKPTKREGYNERQH